MAMIYIIILILQAYFTFKMLPLFASKGIAYLRLFIGISCAILFIVTFTAAVFSVNAFKGMEYVNVLSNYLAWTAWEYFITDHSLVF